MSEVTKSYQIILFLNFTMTLSLTAVWPAHALSVGGIDPKEQYRGLWWLHNVISMALIPLFLTVPGAFSPPGKWHEISTFLLSLIGLAIFPLPFLIGFLTVHFIQNKNVVFELVSGLGLFAMLSYYVVISWGIITMCVAWFGRHRMRRDVLVFGYVAAFLMIFFACFSYVISEAIIG
jgi:hypothetical protein